MAAVALIADAIFALEFTGADIEPHREGVGFHLQSQSGNEFCCCSAPLRLFGCHQCRNRRQYRVRRFFPQFGFCSLQCPYQSFFVSGQVKALILLVASGNVQCSSVGSPALLLQKKGSVCRTQQTVRAGDHIEFILRLLLASVMNEQQANAVFIGKCF